MRAHTHKLTHKLTVALNILKPDLTLTTAASQIIPRHGNNALAAEVSDRVVDMRFKSGSVPGELRKTIRAHPAVSRCEASTMAARRSTSCPPQPPTVTLGTYSVLGTCGSSVEFFRAFCSAQGFPYFLEVHRQRRGGPAEHRRARDEGSEVQGA